MKKESWTEMNSIARIIVPNEFSNSLLHVFREEEAVAEWFKLFD